MTTLTMGARAGEHLAYELNPNYNHEQITVLSGQDLEAGAVLGQINKIIAASPIPAIVGTGTGVMSALSFGPDVQIGNYAIVLTTGGATGAFSVTAPDGTVLPAGAVGTAYVSTHLSFSIANGGTMTIGDAYTVVVSAGGTPVLVGTGTGVVSAFTLGPDAENGTYRVQLLATSATGEFEVTTPRGQKLRRGQVATAYASSHVNFTLANGGTMTVGDYFNIVVANGVKYAAFTPPATGVTYDGRHVPAGILFAAVDASLADVTTGVATVRGPAIVESAALSWVAAATSAQKAAALKRLASAGVIAR